MEPNFLSRRPSNLTQTSYQSPQRHLARAEEGESSQHQSQNIGTETKSCTDKFSFCIDVPWVWKLISLKIVQKFNEKVLIPLYGSGSPWPSYYGLVSSAQFLYFPQNLDQKIFPYFFFDLLFTTVFCRRQVSDCVSSIFKLGGKVGNQVFDLRQLMKFPFLILAGQVTLIKSNPTTVEGGSWFRLWQHFQCACHSFHWVISSKQWTSNKRIRPASNPKLYDSEYIC